MLTFIITIAILSICAWVFKIVWRATLKWCYYLLLETVDAIAKLIVTVRRQGKAIMYLYRRYRNGRTTKTKVNHEEEEVDIDMCPEELQEKLNTGKEVLTHEGDISPTEF